MSQIITIIGKTNVGKSTLFNCLTKKQDSITNNIPFFTRDRKYGKVQLNNKNVTLIDTAALSNEFFSYKKKNITYFINKQTKLAIQEAHIILFLLTTYSHLDSFYKKTIKFITKKNKAIIFIINKIDYMITCSFKKFFGYDQPLLISALHKINIKQLFKRINVLVSKNINKNKNYLKNIYKNNNHKILINNNLNNKLISNTYTYKYKYKNLAKKLKNYIYKNKQYLQIPLQNIQNQPKHVIKKTKTKTRTRIQKQNHKYNPKQNRQSNKLTKICLIGKTNVGKSTLINSLVKETRLIINHQPGTTRENITIKIIYKNHLFMLTDTKGITNNIKQLKHFSKFIHHYDIIFFIIDATMGLFEHDIFLLKQILFAGKHFFLIFNKCDAINKKQKLFLKQFLFLKFYHFTNFLTIHFISALYLYNFNSIFHSLDFFLYLKTKIWSINFLTKLLNLAIKKKPLFKKKHKLIFLLAKQININPIIIVIFGQEKLNLLPNHYKRYLFNFLVENLKIKNSYLQIHYLN